MINVRVKAIVNFSSPMVLHKDELFVHVLVIYEHRTQKAGGVQSHNAFADILYTAKNAKYG